MDGVFACPECGNTLEVRGLSPGRHVRCEFCDRLVEIPFIPRVTDTSWRRSRFHQSPRQIVIWSSIGIVFIVLLFVALTKLALRQSRIERFRSVERLVESSAKQKESGVFGPALIDLDAAIDLLESMRFPEATTRLTELRRLRAEISRRDVEKSLSELGESSSRTDDSSLGGWLTLRARIDKDPDLLPLKSKLESEFAAYLQNKFEVDIAIASQLGNSGRLEESLKTCLRIERELTYLPPDTADRWRSRVEAIVTGMIQSNGAVIVISTDDARIGSGRLSYLDLLRTTAAKVLQEKSYLILPDATPWDSLRSRSPYILNVEVAERWEGNYLSSRNRLARIMLRLQLTRASHGVWGGEAQSRSRVPLQGIPSSIANQLIVNPGRIDELELLLYQDAKSAIAGRLTEALRGMPPCPGRSGELPESR